MNASCNSNLSFIPIFLCNKIISPDIIVTTPSPPIWISKRITTCPKTLHDETVGITTNPVTQVAVVAVNKASQKEAALPCAELIGNDRKNVPVKIVSRKPIIIIRVVVNENLFFIIAPIYVAVFSALVKSSSSRFKPTSICCLALCLDNKHTVST